MPSYEQEISMSLTREIFDTGELYTPVLVYTPENAKPDVDTILYQGGSFMDPTILLKETSADTALHARNILKFAKATGVKFVAMDCQTQMIAGKPIGILSAPRKLHIAKAVMQEHDNGHLNIVGNSGGAYPLLKAASEIKTTLNSFVGIGATVVTNKLVQAGLDQYKKFGVITPDEIVAMHKGRAVQLPYPTPESAREWFTQASIDGAGLQDGEELCVKVDGNIHLVFGEKDQYRSAEALEKLMTCFRFVSNSTRPILTKVSEVTEVPDDGHDLKQSLPTIQRSLHRALNGFSS